MLHFIAVFIVKTKILSNKLAMPIEKSKIYLNNYSENM